VLQHTTFSVRPANDGVLKHTLRQEIEGERLNIVFYLAQPTSQGTSANLPWYANPQIVLLLMIAGVFMWLMYTSGRTKRAEQAVRDDMLKNMKRGDRVQTIGGILGTVVDVRDTEVVLKVDESANTKIRFAREAIKLVIPEGDTAATIVKPK
jgi:preprotein translocase subunit YajC